MKKFYILFQLLFLLCFATAKAQSLYCLNNAWLDLETFTKSDSATSTDTDFKKAGKYARRFTVPASMADAPKSVAYNGKIFRIIDGNSIGIKGMKSTHEVVLSCNAGGNEYDTVAGSNFLLPVADGVVHVQRFESETGYRITKYSELGKVIFRQNFPHTQVTQQAGVEYKRAYLNYLVHTDKYIVFTSMNTHDIHKTIIVDLDNGKVMHMESSLCGTVRSPDDKVISGYLIRDEKAKTLSVSTASGKWALKENNAAKAMGETLINDTMLVMAKYYKASPGISLAAFNVKTGKLLWIADVKKPTAAQNNLYLSMYKNKVLMEGNDTNGNYLQAFDIATGKRTYSTL